MESAALCANGRINTLHSRSTQVHGKIYSSEFSVSTRNNLKDSSSRCVCTVKHPLPSYIFEINVSAERDDNSNLKAIKAI